MLCGSCHFVCGDITLKVLPPDRRHVFRDAKCAARLLRDGWCVGRRRMMVSSVRRESLPPLPVPQAFLLLLQTIYITTDAGGAQSRADRHHKRRR